MTVSPTSPSAPPGAAPPPDDPVAAARQFESVLVRQFVEVMTKDLFQSQDGGLLTGQADLQRDTLTDTLTEHLVGAGTFGIADLLTAQWDRQGYTDGAGPESAGLEGGPPSPSPPGTLAPGSPSRTGPTSSRPSDPVAVPRPAGRALTMDDALRLYPPAKAPARPIDHTPDSP